MYKWFFISLLVFSTFFIDSCKKKDVPLVENGFFFDYKEYSSSRYGGCVAGGIVNYTWDVNLVNIPATGSIDVTSSYYSNDCEDCCGVQITNVPITETYVAVSGRVWHEGPLVGFDVEVRDINDLSNGKNIQLKGSYICDD